MGSPEDRKARGQAGYVILNSFQDLNEGRLEDERIGWYAVIGERSSHEIIFPRHGELTFVRQKGVRSTG